MRTVHEYVQDYEWRGDQDHTPTDDEKALIEDAINGYLAETGPYAEELEKALWHRHDTSDYDPEVCEECAVVKKMLDGIQAKHLKVAFTCDESEIVSTAYADLCDNCGYNRGCHRKIDQACPVFSTDEGFHPSLKWEPKTIPAIGHVFTFPPEPAPDRWQRIHSRDELEAFYHHILPRIRAAARTCGYAIAVHGSMRRDLDLIAAPWVADHADRDALALAVSRAASGVGLDRFEWKEGEKPCGRVAVTLPICWCEWPDLPRDEKSTGCIDLSVMPDTILSQGTTLAQAVADGEAAFEQAYAKLHEPSEGWESDRDKLRDFYTQGWLDATANRMTSQDSPLPPAEQRYRDGLDEAMGKAIMASSVEEAVEGIRSLMHAHGREYAANSRNEIEESKK